MADLPRIARVFPRRTKATPTDELAFVGEVPLLRPEVDEVHVSVAFTYDLPEAERLADSWGRFYPVKIGGPATGQRGEDFEPGMYLREGYTITSRGCPNRCWFCSVWKRDGGIRELPIRDGFDVLDDNLLATSWEHFSAVCDMLGRQKEHARFTGGLEAARFTEAHAERLATLTPKSLFFAYDTPDDWEPLVEAMRILARHKWWANALRCFVLVGYPRDTLLDAEQRLIATTKLGFLPMAMAWRGTRGRVNRGWRKLQSAWARPATAWGKVRSTKSDESLLRHAQEGAWNDGTQEAAGV